MGKRRKVANKDSAEKLSREADTRVAKQFFFAATSLFRNPAFNSSRSDDEFATRRVQFRTRNFPVRAPILSSRAGLSLPQGKISRDPARERCSRLRGDLSEGWLPRKRLCVCWSRPWPRSRNHRVARPKKGAETSRLTFPTLPCVVVRRKNCRLPYRMDLVDDRGLIIRGT